MPVLRIVDQPARVAWQVWPEAEEIPAGAIHETGNYVFELDGSDDAATADLAIDDVVLEPLRCHRPDLARWRWQPGFHAGTIEADLRLPGRAPKHFEIVTDPDRRKLTRADFDAMVREILDDTFALFSLSGFRKSVARGSGVRAPPIARLEFLRSRIGELEAVIAAISRSPRRRLAADDAVLPYRSAARATGPEILRSFRSGRILREAGSGPSRLPDALRGFLPENLRVRRKENSLDTPEHRQMAACLRYWASWLTAIAELLHRQEQITADADAGRSAALWSRRCAVLSRRLAQQHNAAIFSTVGEAPAQLRLSAVFRNDPNYRRFYRLWQDMNRGIAAVFGDFLSLPLARTFELYELWCFLRLTRAAADEFGADSLALGDLFKTDASGGVTLATGAVIVPVAAGWKLCFQRQYREFWREPDGRGSYSRVMAPDVVIARDATGTTSELLIVLDAKYRIEDGLNDALSSIHTYRDALVHEVSTGATKGIVSAAYLMAPYVPELQVGYRETQLPGRLFHPTYRAGFRFGAVTLRPGMSMEDIITALRLIVCDASRPAA